MSTESPSKREVPAALRSLLEADKRLTKRCCEAFDRAYGLARHRAAFKYLEVSCHGLPWLGGVLAALYLRPAGVELWVNLLWLLVLDLVVVAVLKAVTRRRRPALNRPDMFATVSVDKFSFPSGHSTRAVALALFFWRQRPLPFPLPAAVAAWAAAVCASRVLLGRHHLLDVAGGVAVGAAEHLALAATWMGEDAARAVGDYFFGDDPWSNA